MNELAASEPEDRSKAVFPYHLGISKPLGGTTLLLVYVLRPPIVLLMLPSALLLSTTPPQNEHLT